MISHAIGARNARRRTSGTARRSACGGALGCAKHGLAASAGSCCSSERTAAGGCWAHLLLTLEPVLGSAGCAELLAAGIEVFAGDDRLTRWLRDYASLTRGCGVRLIATSLTVPVTGARVTHCLP